MKETYEMSEDGELVITWEAETPEEMAELKEQALRIAAQALPDGDELEVWSSSEADHG